MVDQKELRFTVGEVQALLEAVQFAQRDTSDLPALTEAARKLRQELKKLR